MSKKSPWGLNDLMVTAAHRYCMNRSTYIVSECVDWLIENWSKFKPETRKRILKDTKEAIDMGIVVHILDVTTWNRIMELKE